MLDNFQKFLEILSTKSNSELMVYIAMAVIFGGVYTLWTEYKSMKKKVNQLYKDKEELHDEKLEMSQEMLKMANEYNQQMVTLQRETSSTITSLMAMFNIMRDR